MLTEVQVLMAAGLQGEVSAVLTSSSAVNCFGKQPWPASLGSGKKKAAGGERGCMHVFIHSTTQLINSLSELFLSSSYVPGTMSGQGIQ